MKRPGAILLLFLYTNIAFGIGIDCHYCEGKITGTTIHGFTNESSKCIPSTTRTGCCRSESLNCKADNHEATVVTVLPGYSLNEHLTTYPSTAKLQFPGFVFARQFDLYCLKRATSSREILSFIHILRI